MTNATYLQREAQMDRFGLKVASQLDDLPLAHDISERLRIARQQALAQRKVAVAAQMQMAGSVSLSGSAAVLGGGDANGSDWFSRILGTVPLIALAIGLIAINALIAVAGAAQSSSGSTPSKRQAWRGVSATFAPNAAPVLGFAFTIAAPTLFAASPRKPSVAPDSRAISCASTCSVEASG